MLSSVFRWRRSFSIPPAPSCQDHRQFFYLPFGLITSPESSQNSSGHNGPHQKERGTSLSLFLGPPVAVLRQSPAAGSQETVNLHLDQLRLAPKSRKKTPIQRQMFFGAQFATGSISLPVGKITVIQERILWSLIPSGLRAL